MNSVLLSRTVADLNMAIHILENMASLHIPASQPQLLAAVERLRETTNLLTTQGQNEVRSMVGVRDAVRDVEMSFNRLRELLARQP